MNLSNSGNFGFDRERGTEETLSLPIQMLQLKTRAKLLSPFSVGDLPFNAPYSPRNVTSGARWWLVAWGLCDGRKKEEIEIFIISERKKNICDCNRLSYGNS